MKVILSRKGFDSERGGYASPILPDARLLSLPIPNTPDSSRYCELKLTPSMTYYDLMRELNKKKYIKYIAPGDTKSRWHNLELGTECHLDPDIYPGVIERHKDWRPLFGQCGAAQTILDKHNIQKGDIFLFFGRFKKTQSVFGKLKFDPSDKDRHIIFGYFQIDEKILISGKINIYEWIRYHSHISRSDGRRNNTVYIASETLSWNAHLPGAGVFKFDRSLVLTKEGHSCSRWQLPSFFKGLNISYHDLNSWKDGYFQSRSRGQEFVIEESEEVENWVKDLIARNVFKR